MAKERVTLKGKKLFENQSVEEYGKFLNKVAEDSAIEVLELIWSSEAQMFYMIGHMDTEGSPEWVTKLSLCDKDEYLTEASKSNTRYLV